MTLYSLIFSMIPMYLQSAIMVMISQARVRDFLVLPELKIIEHIIPDDK